MRSRGENIEYDKLRDRYEALAAELARREEEVEHQAQRANRNDKERTVFAARIAHLESALRETIDYITLDSEYPIVMVNRWEAALSGARTAE